MGPFDLGNGLFFISVLTTTYFIEHKVSTLYTMCVHTLSFLYCMIGEEGGGLTTQRRGALLGNVSKKVGKHCRSGNRVGVTSAKLSYAQPG